MKYEKNIKLLTMKHQQLYELATSEEKLKFFEYNDWIKKKVDKINLEHMYAE